MTNNQRGNMAKWTPEILKVRKQNIPLFTKLNQLFTTTDPIGMSSEEWVESYDLELSTVIPRLPTTKSWIDVKNVIVEEFSYWFTEGITSRIIWDDLAQKTWEIYQETLA